MNFFSLNFSDEHDHGFTFNFRKESNIKELSEISYKDKYGQVYENYINNIAYVPGYKNRSNAVKAALNFGQAQNSFSYPSKFDRILSIHRSEEKQTISGREIIAELKEKKNTKPKTTPTGLPKRSKGKHYTPQKELTKF